MKFFKEKDIDKTQNEKDSLVVKCTQVDEDENVFKSTNLSRIQGTVS